MEHMTFSDFVNEAKVGAQDVYRASENIVKYLERRLGGDFVFVDGQEYSNSSGHYFGYLFVTHEGHAALRVNWDGGEFHSINFWNDYETEMSPALEIFTSKIAPGQSSFARLLPAIAEIIKNGGIQDDEDLEGMDDLEESANLNEDYEYNGKIYKSKTEIVGAMYDEGKSVKEIQDATHYPPGHIRNLIAKHTGASAPKTAGKGDVIKVVKGANETITPSRATKKAQEILDDTEYADPNIVFAEMADYCTLVGKGLMPALLITGQGGVGKSFTVTDVLKKYGEKGKDYVIMKGHCTPYAMYKFLYLHYNQICVFDDCDSIFDTADGMNILKGALDSGDHREISWMTKGGDIVDTFGMESHEDVEQALAEWSSAHNGKEGTPSYFQFEGAVIFISNLSKQAIYKKDRALPSRCTCIDITLTAKGVIQRIKTVLPHIKIFSALKGRGKNGGRDITDEAIKQEVFEWISSDEYLNDPKMRGKELNFRLFNQVYTYRYAGLENWRQLSFRAGG